MSKLINKELKINKEKVETAIILVIIILLAIMIGFLRIYNSDFNPVDGDFQNYNPVRRFLAGQTPYKDFTVYLGTGHLLLLSTIQLIVGNNFTLSLFITNTVTILMFELALFVISYLVTKNKKQALYITLLGVTIVLLNPKFITSIFSDHYQFINALSIATMPRRISQINTTYNRTNISNINFYGIKWN